VRLDAADLALLEIDIEALDPLGRDIAKLLLDRIREDEDRVDVAERALDAARDEASDAEIALNYLRPYLRHVPIEAERKADDVERCLDRIRRT
jgi:hypothetical protein